MCLVLTPEGVGAFPTRNSPELVFFHGWPFIKSFAACGDEEYSGYVVPVDGRDLPFYYHFVSSQEQALFLETGQRLAIEFAAYVRMRNAERGEPLLCFSTLHGVFVQKCVYASAASTCVLFEFVRCA